MPLPIDHPFKPGTRVALKRGYNEADYEERFVDRVLKTGHFLLRGNPTQRWRPHSYVPYGEEKANTRWSATPTGGDQYSRLTVLLWDETTDKEISQAIATTKRRSRWNNARTKIERLSFDQVTDELLNAIETALQQLSPP
jgi:hypothetical protein